VFLLAITFLVAAVSEIEGLAAAWLGLSALLAFLAPFLTPRVRLFEVDGVWRSWVRPKSRSKLTQARCRR
jgi:hypothetical protein